MDVPIVMIDHEDHLISCDLVFNNNFSASEKVTNYLIGLGHRKLQFVGNISFSRSFYDRWVGFRSTLELSEPEMTIDASLSTIHPRAFKTTFSDWLLQKKQANDLPSAFVCTNDQMARRVITVLEDNGWSVPRDFSVTGFDNLEDSYQGTPTLTTVHLEKEELGKRGVEVLIRRLAEKDSPYEKVLLEGSMILRESASRPHVETIDIWSK